jgi:hypothetical protein
MDPGRRKNARGALDAVQAVLKVNGVLPRRAVLLPDGSLSDKTLHPGQREVELVSRLCEVVRESSGAPCHPRHTAQLMDQALTTNAPAAWSAIQDDLATNDFDANAAAALLQQQASPTCLPLVACLLDAKDGKHVTAVVVAVAAVLPALSQDACNQLGGVVACHLNAIADAFAKHGALMPRDARDAVLSGFGKIMGRVGVPAARATEAMLHALSIRKEELLRMFLHLPPAPLVEHVPDLARVLVSHALGTPAAARFPLLAMLARLAPSHVAPVIRPQVAELVSTTLTSLVADAQLDSRTCLVAATLVGALATDTRGGDGVDGSDGPLVTALAQALTACSAALVRAGLR